MDLILAKGFIGMPNGAPPIEVADVLSVHTDIDDVDHDPPHWVAYVRMKNGVKANILLATPVAYPNAERDATEAAERFAKAFHSARLGGSATYTPTADRLDTNDDTSGVLRRYDVTGVTSSCSRTLPELYAALGRPVTAISVVGADATVTFTVYSTTTSGALVAGEAYVPHALGSDWSWSATLSQNQHATPDLGQFVIMEGRATMVKLTSGMIGL